MAITATLVFVGHNRLRYFINATAGAGEQVEIPSTGGPTPDLLTDSVAGPLKQIARVKTQGYGQLVAGGALTQGQVRALLLSNSNPLFGGFALASNPPTAICRFEQRAGALHSFLVDADVGSGDPLTPSLVITALAIGSGYLEIEIPGSIGA